MHTRSKRAMVIDTPPISPMPINVASVDTVLQTETQKDLQVETPRELQVETPTELQVETTTVSETETDLEGGKYEYVDFEWEGGHEWEVERIVDQNEEGYLIKWKDFDETFNSRESRDAIKGYHGLEDWDYEHNNANGDLQPPKRLCRRRRECTATKRRRHVENVVKVFK